MPRREVAHDRVVLGRAHVTGGEDGVVVANEREHLGGLGEQRAVFVGHRDPGAGQAELRTDPAVVVLLARERREPHDARTEAERDLDRGRVHATDLAIATDAAEHGDVGNHLPHRPRERRGGEVVRLEDDGPMARGRGLAGRFERVDRALAMRVGTEVTVQVGGTAQINTHAMVASRADAARLRWLPPDATAHVPCTAETIH